MESKRPPDEVLFKWDPKGNFTSLGPTPGANFTKRRMTNLHNSYKIINQLKLNELELDKILKESTTEGLNVRPETLEKLRDKRAELLKNLKKFQLHSCKDWLGENTPKSSIHKVDTLDRLSSMIINPEFPIKHEAVLYSVQLGKSDLEFYNALYLTKLTRMSNPTVLELIRQPVFIRDRMLLLTDRKTCNCPLNAITKQTTQRHLLPRRSFHDTHSQDGILNKLMSPSANPMSPGLFSSDRSWSQTLLGAEKKHEVPKDDISDEDIVCPFHVAQDLPEPLKSPKGHSGYIKDYNLLYRSDSTANEHFLILHQLTGDRVGTTVNNTPDIPMRKYKLPSKLLSINSVYLRDFEFERHYSCKPGDLRSNPVTTGDTVSLSSVYTGLALFIATKTEFLICITDHTRLTFCTPNTQSSCTPDNTSLKFCILLREKNLGHSVVEILSHKSTGRIFLLATNSLLYEYQYQLGFKSTSLLDHKIFRHIYNTFVYGKNLVTACIRRNTVYSLPSTNLTNTNSVTRNNSVYNCLEGLEKPVVGSVLYYPPLLWGQSDTNNRFNNNTLDINTFDNNTLDNRSQCACGLGCRRYKVSTYLRCINPWNKTYMKMSDSIGIIDQDRSIISLLNSSTGDLSVFYIHSNISLQEYTNSIHRGHRIFPYDLTLYNLRHNTIISTLDKLGYGRHSYGTKFVKMLAPPVNFVQGVDLIIVDNLGTRIFIGFSNLSLVNTTGIASVTATLNPSDTIHITPNSNTNTQSTLSTSAQSTSAQSKLVLSVKGFRVSMRNVCQGVGFARGPFSLFRAKPNVSSFMVDDLFITMEPVRKNNNGTLIRVILTSNDSTSFFQNYPTLPLSVTEEFYYFNEDLRYKNLQENQPVEYYHEFYLKLTDKEKILSVHMETSVFPGKPDSISVNQELINKELNCKSNELGDSVTGSKMVIVTTEKVYKFNRLDLNLIIKLLIKYTKNAVDLIKPPPILCTPTHNRNSTNSTVNYSQDERDEPDAQDEGERFILNKYIKGDKEENYFINSLKVGKLSECPVNSVNTNPGTADMSEYMKYLQGNKKNELTDIFGEDLVEVCENSKELVGYSLYYLSWLYGPETLFKHLFTYLTELKQDFDHISDNTVVNSVNTSNVVNTVNTMNETVDRDIIYKYLLCSLDDYNVFMGSFGIPSRIFNYVVPGCYSVLDHKFEKPVISPWCNFVSFSNNNKVKHARVTANTSPLVDGLLLLVSELLTPIYLNRVLNLVPNLHTLTVINGVEGNFNPISVNRVRYTLNNLVLDKFEDENEFVVGSRVDTYLTTELSMGLEMAMKQLEQLNSLHSIALELIKNYQKCNLENVILLMTTLGPNVQRMILKPNLHQYEPYPVNSGPLPDSFSTTPFTDLYHTNGTGDTTANTGDTTVNTVDALKSLIIERYEADLRTLKELVLVLEVAQEFLASCVLLHRSTALGDYKYEFDKNLHLVTLLPSKTANSFFTPSDYVPKSDKFVTPFKCKFTRESPKSKLTITHSILNIIAQANLINLFLNKDVYKLFRIVVWLIGGDTSALEKFFYGHIFTFEEITSMNRCNRVKYLERHFENTQDASKCEYIHSLIKQFTIN